jgi:hypothetical protein
LGNGDGTFQNARNFTTGLGSLSVAVGDFNGDRIPDLAVANFSNSVSVLLGNGDGTFPTVANFPAGSQPVSVAVGDFNGDGIPDVAVANEGSNNVSVLLGNGDGTLQTARNFAAGTLPESVAVGDFNGDGIPDLAVANEASNNVSVLLGNGDGTFQAARNFYAGLRPRSVAVGDVNADGKLDLIATGYDWYCDPYENCYVVDATVRVLVGNGDGSFQAARSFPCGDMPTTIAVGDFNGDGVLDVAVASAYSSAGSVLLGNGDGTFQAPLLFRDESASSVAVGDFNGDDVLDLAVASFNSSVVSVLLGNGDGTFQSARLIPTGSIPVSVAVGDVNGDGLLDLIVGAGTVRVLLGNGDGSFQTTHISYAGCSGAVALGDFNGDGWPDVAGASGYNSVSILLNDAAWPGPHPGPGGRNSHLGRMSSPARPGPLRLAAGTELLLSDYVPLLLGDRALWAAFLAAAASPVTPNMPSTAPGGPAPIENVERPYLAGQPEESSHPVAVTPAASARHDRQARDVLFADLGLAGIGGILANDRSWLSL